MGTKRERLARFLIENPLCCYCGGNTTSTTEDHWPSRSIFDERKWPEGYVFPACNSCNQATASDEALFSLLCRLSKHSSTEALSNDTLKLFKAVEERLPAIGNTFRQKASVPDGPLHQVGRKPDQFNVLDRPFALSINHPDVHERVKRCATKLLFSLHYFHTRRIVPKGGGAIWEWLTNGSRQKDAYLTGGMRSFLSSNAEVNWQKIDLNDQFEYQYGIYGECDNGFASVYEIRFHRTISISGVVFEDLAHLGDVLPSTQLLRPFS